MKSECLSGWPRNAQAKSGAREQPITGELADYLRNRMQMLPPGCEWLFPSPASAAGHVHTIRKAFRRLVEGAGMDPDEITRTRSAILL